MGSMQQGGGDIDPASLEARYAAEREKRAHNGGPDQYLVPEKSNLEEYLKDPYVDPGFIRNSVKGVYDVVIVGGGYTGVQVAARLIAAGITNILVIEKGGDFGGTWYWNRYPGVQCDIDAYIYMPLLEELGALPTRKYVSGTELFQHAKNIANKYDITSRTLFQTEMTKGVWNDDTSLWDIHTDRDDDIKCQWFVPAQGPLHTPKFPGLRGIQSFSGKAFHSCRWDYAYTGGTAEVPDLTKLADKKVGIIGTGATAVQIVPRVAEWAKELYVFQRTPSSVDARNNKPTDSKWAKSLSKGWQQKRSQNFTDIINGVKVEEDLVDDGWTAAIKSTPGFFGTGSDNSKELANQLKLADFKKMEYIRNRISDIVKDPKTAEGLKPWYQQFCKRPCFHDEYLQSFNKQNVFLVDTQGKGVQSVTPRGVIANGEEVELDCIIYATGFQFGGDFSESNGKIVGRNGVTLSEKWADGPSTFHGWAVNGFPNLMILGPVQAAPNPNWTHSMVEMGSHFLYLVETCKQRGIKVLEISPEAEMDWVKDAIVQSEGRADFLKECTPGYYNNDGVVDEKTLRAQPYGGGGIKFNAHLTRWREEGSLSGTISHLQNNGSAKSKGSAQGLGKSDLNDSSVSKKAYLPLELL